MLTESHRTELVDRLMQIVSKQVVIVQTTNGPVEDEVAADKNAIAAAKLLIAIEAQAMKFEQQQARLAGSRASAETTRKPHWSDATDTTHRSEAEDTTQLTGASSFGGHVPQESLRAGNASGQRSRKHGNSRPVATQGHPETSYEAETDSAVDVVEPHCEHRNGRSFANDDAEQTPSDFHRTAEDVVREAVRQARLELEELSDYVDNDAVIAANFAWQVLDEWSRPRDCGFEDGRLEVCLTLRFGLLSSFKCATA